MTMKSLGTWEISSNYHKTLMQARVRGLAILSLILVSFTCVTFRLLDVMVIRSSITKNAQSLSTTPSLPFRALITDRHGNILSTNIVTASVYANPTVLLNAQDAARKLATLFPDLGVKLLYKRLTTSKNFVWIARHIAPHIQQKIYNLGIPGVYLKKDQRRIHPYGSLASHVLGFCNLNMQGVSGVEKFFNTRLQKKHSPLVLSLDIRVQYIIREELQTAIQEFQADGGNVLLMDIESGDIVASVSLPDFDSNIPQSHDVFFNRNTSGLFEPGSIFKVFNVAMALDSGSAYIHSRYDVRDPIQIGNFLIKDPQGHGQNLSLSEVLVYSSNVASIQIAQKTGIQKQKAYLQRFGMLTPTTIEVPEVTSPRIPKTWHDTVSMTVSYGYGVAVTPIQIIAAFSALVHNGIWVQPTLVLHKAERRPSQRFGNLVTQEVSTLLRRLMRRVVQEGTARKADVREYQVFGKTGTAYQSIGRSGYDNGKKRTTSFLGGFPFYRPRYALLIMLNDPKSLSPGSRQTSASWNSAPLASRIIRKIAPVLGVEPLYEHVKPVELMKFPVQQIRG